jgi:hypothetical protein
MTEFDTYQGASTISRKTLDWKSSKISMFELDVVPQSWMPYVQMNLSKITLLAAKFSASNEIPRFTIM